MIPRSRAKSTCPRSQGSGRAAAANLAEILDLTSPPDLTAPQWDVPAFASLPCPAGQYAGCENWHQLAALARAAGCPVGTKPGPSPAMTTRPAATDNCESPPCPSPGQGRVPPSPQLAAAPFDQAVDQVTASSPLAGRAHHQRRGLAAPWA
jgi:hypothetical protein